MIFNIRKIFSIFKILCKVGTYSTLVTKIIKQGSNETISIILKGLTMKDYNYSPKTV